MLQSPRILLVFNLLDSLIYLVFFRKGIYRKILGVKVFALDKKRIKTKVLEVGCQYCPWEEDLLHNDVS